jgi:uncharacterized protein with HEPN domain
VRRDSRVYLEDILASAAKIRAYMGGVTRDQFDQDGKTLDAVVRNLEIIGEAVKQPPEAVRAKGPDIEWQKIAGLRDILIHAYSRVDIDIIWDVVTNKLPEFAAKVRALSDRSLE